jgi:hypothetical protein
MPAPAYDAIVTGLLAGARLTVSDTEKAAFVADYPLIRTAADGLYLPELEFVEPAVAYDPRTYYSAS